ncbi:MAG: hypothetical protein PHF36_09240, partial [Candidatus Cloacimonetes bacterium]|nr:hypothetical protein [Candidatus Cloacimonadota bacterium]
SDKSKCIKKSFPDGLYYDNQKIYCKGKHSKTVEHFKLKSYLSIWVWLKEVDPDRAKKYMKLQTMKSLYTQLSTRDKNLMHLLKLKHSQL